MQWLSDLIGWLSIDTARIALKVAAILATGLLAQRLISRRIAALQKRFVHLATLRPVASALILVVSFIWALAEVGVDITVLVGAAGILTVALGFASQTSASNLISGIFLMGEQAFVVGDVVKVEDTIGEVLSIDLLSMRLRTFDNLLVRIPNETMLKAKVTNLTYFPIRRIDMQLGVAYHTDVGAFVEVLLAVADANPLCLEEPKPLIIHSGFGDSALLFQFSFWATRESYLDVRNAMHNEVKQALDTHGIEIPFPQRTLWLHRDENGSPPTQP